MLESIVLVIGIVVALAFVFFGTDDLLWDIYTLFHRVKIEHIDLAALDQKPPRMLAVVIAAWHEDAVIGDVVGNLLESTNYPSDMYRVFLGVYPNDPATIAVADRLATVYPNVVKVVNSKDGPTSKSNNLNHIIGQIMIYEKKKGIRFASVTIHDSEDVIHPFELKVTNSLIDEYDALQFPVFPLMRMPHFGNFFKTLTVGTYADEFAEHHFRTLSIRDQLGFVPSAGTGFCLNRSFLDVYGGGLGAVMREDSLTEDYQLSLNMSKAGYRVHYVLERIPQIDSQGQRRWNYIATRSIFPQKFKLAVRQKTRWIYGITMQSAKARDIFAKSKLDFRDRTFLYKDLKAKYANLILLPGYLVFVYFLVSLFDSRIPVMYPVWSFGWWLSVVLVFMIIERQFLRGMAIVKAYGKRMLFFSCLLPPLFPIRLIWGNIINLCATLRAWKQGFSFNHAAKSVRVPDTTAEMLRDRPATEPPQQKWAKTEHEFLPKDVLRRYRPHYGDYLLMKGALSQDSLREALVKRRFRSTRLGEQLLGDGIVSAQDLAEATAAQNNTVFVHLTPALMDRIIRFPLDVCNDVVAWPILETSGGYLAVAPENSDGGPTFEQRSGKPVFMLIADSSELDEAMHRFRDSDSSTSDGEALDDDLNTLASLCDEGSVTLTQAGIALGYAVNEGTGIVSVLRSMGLIHRYADTNQAS
jgi:adsorption protein B